jgi:hypothetical protein
MQDTAIGKIIIGIVIVVCIGILIFTDFGKSNVKVYDCGMAEWHPDIPPEVKIECRKLRREQHDRQNQTDNIDVPPKLEKIIET